MICTVRFAHLESRPAYGVGHVLRRGDRVGRMGSTGASTAAHLHLDVARGLQAGRYSLADLEAGRPTPDPRQAALFVDAELFGVPPAITTGYADPDYLFSLNKLHCGFDVVPFNRHQTKENFEIRWNRSVPGRVVAILEDDPGYGYCVSIAYEVPA